MLGQRVGTPPLAHPRRHGPLPGPGKVEICPIRQLEVGAETRDDLRRIPGRATERNGHSGMFFYYAGALGPLLASIL